MVRTAGGEKGRTDEHCFAKWLSQYVEGGGESWQHTRANSSTGAVVHRWTHRELNIVTNRVCRDCNGGWMNELERAARPFLTSLVQGRGRHLYRDGQRVLAAWATKTALCLELATPGPEPIPVEHYRSMAELGDTPPPRTQVFAGAYRGDRLLFHFPSMVNLPGDAHGYRTTFIVGRALFNVMAHDGSGDWVFQKGGLRATQTPQIWPTVTLPVIWPPIRGEMNDEALWRYVDT